MKRRLLMHYWNSKFLGHTHSDDLVKAFIDGLNECNLTKLIQISMDCPNSNLEFLTEIKKLRIKDELAYLIDIGCCNLQAIHGAFKTGSKSSNWNLHKMLKWSFTLLHDTPACQDDYFSMTGSSEYPLQFCGTRWVENKMVAEKLIKLWPNMIKVFDFWSSLCKLRETCSKNYKNTKKGIEDPLTVAKLHFFLFVAGLLQPFLKVFQGDGPMIPFLCNSIRSTYISLLKLIVKAKVLENVESHDLLQVVNNDNLLQTKKYMLDLLLKVKLKGFCKQNRLLLFLYLKCGTYYNIMLVFNFPSHLH